MKIIKFLLATYNVVTCLPRVLLIVVLYLFVWHDVSAGTWTLVNGTNHSLAFAMDNSTGGTVYVPANTITQVNWSWVGNNILRVYRNNEWGSGVQIPGISGQWVDGGDVNYYVAVMQRITNAGVPQYDYYATVYRQNDTTGIVASASAAGGEGIPMESIMGPIAAGFGLVVVPLTILYLLRAVRRGIKLSGGVPT